MQDDGGSGAARSFRVAVGKPVQLSVDRVQSLSVNQMRAGRWKGCRSTVERMLGDSRNAGGIGG
jgi:hypothetical protein